MEKSERLQNIDKAFEIIREAISFIKENIEKLPDSTTKEQLKNIIPTSSMNAMSLDLLLSVSVAMIEKPSNNVPVPNVEAPLHSH